MRCVITEARTKQRFGTGFSRSGSVAWSTRRSGKIPKRILLRCNCRSARPSSRSHRAVATRCPTSRLSRHRSSPSISTKLISRCLSSSSRVFVRFPGTRIFGNSSARRPRPPTRPAIATNCGLGSTPTPAPIGTKVIWPEGRGTPISPTASIVTACSAASSALLTSWQNWLGSI